MQREPPADQTRLWLRYSAEDLRAASYVLQANPPFVEDALFHCQQAAEKAFKAFLTWHDQPFRRTHSIEEVGEQCLLIDDSLRTVVDAAAPLTG
jgi:HEPN domain-containing protein